MTISILIGTFLMIYVGQHGRYLNVLDVALMSTAAFFALAVIMVLIASWKNK